MEEPHMESCFCNGGETVEKISNAIEFEVYGSYALFADPVMQVGGEKTTYHISKLYEALGDCGKHLLETTTFFG